jgi:hypothetical protein
LSIHFIAPIEAPSQTHFSPGRSERSVAGTQAEMEDGAVHRESRPPQAPEIQPTQKQQASGELALQRERKALHYAGSAALLIDLALRPGALPAADRSFALGIMASYCSNELDLAPEAAWRQVTMPVDETIGLARIADNEVNRLAFLANFAERQRFCGTVRGGELRSAAEKVADVATNPDPAALEGLIYLVNAGDQQAELLRRPDIASRIWDAYRNSNSTDLAATAAGLLAKMNTGPFSLQHRHLDVANRYFGPTAEQRAFEIRSAALAIDMCRRFMTCGPGSLHARLESAVGYHAADSGYDAALRDMLPPRDWRAAEGLAAEIAQWRTQSRSTSGG